MPSLDDEWLMFKSSKKNYNSIKKGTKKEEKKVPKAGQLNISTQTKIVYLNQPIDIYNIFWKLQVMKYYEKKEGIIKKSIKINCANQSEVDKLEIDIKTQKYVDVHIINQINTVQSKKKKFKDVRKIDVGLCSNDFITNKKKKKGAFYNCIALRMRYYYNGTYRELHMKVFNTGKIEVPGLKTNDILIKCLKQLIVRLQPFIREKLEYREETIVTVLINSNFNCGFYINRDKLYNILKFQYNIHSLLDKCTYPGIQCKYYHNETGDGVCHCQCKCGKKNSNKTNPILDAFYKKNKKTLVELNIKNNITIQQLTKKYPKELNKLKKKCEDKIISKKDFKYYTHTLDKLNGVLTKIDQRKKCTEISFMIFRTGSILIVGNCEENIIRIVHKFVKKILQDNFQMIHVNCVENKKKSKTIVQKKKIITITKE